MREILFLATILASVGAEHRFLTVVREAGSGLLSVGERAELTAQLSQAAVQRLFTNAATHARVTFTRQADRTAEAWRLWLQLGISLLLGQTVSYWVWPRDADVGTTIAFVVPFALAAFWFLEVVSLREVVASRARLLSTAAFVASLFALVVTWWRLSR